MVQICQRWALLIELRPGVPCAHKVQPCKRLFRLADGHTFDSALKLNELTAPLGEEPRWFVSYEEVTRTQVRLTQAALRALAFWLTDIGAPRRMASAEVTILEEQDARRYING